MDFGVVRITFPWHFYHVSIYDQFTTPPFRLRLFPLPRRYVIWKKSISFSVFLAPSSSSLCTVDASLPAPTLTIRQVSSATWHHYALTNDEDGKPVARREVASAAEPLLAFDAVLIGKVDLRAVRYIPYRYVLLRL